MTTKSLAGKSFRGTSLGGKSLAGMSLAGAFAGSLLMATALTPAGAADMTNERALNPQQEPQNWILHHGNYQGHRFSLLKEIDTNSVKNMRLAYTVALSGFQSGGRYAFGNLEATPIVEDGMMYVPDGWGSVYAIDLTAGKKGTIKWKMDPGTDRAWAGDVACCGVNNRGVALWKDKIISIALDGRMFAINKATGEVVWERKVADPALGETLTVAPLIIRDLAIVGAAGGEFGIRGYIEATDLNTGKAAWRTYTIPGTGEPGNETWKDGKDRWKHGGGSIWETATYDPESDTFYQGVGNAGPDYDIAYRPGDNKWAASVLAISPNDGKIKWGFQYTPQDPYDFDEISEHPDHQWQDQRRGPQARGARRAQRLLLCARPHQRLVHRRQAVYRPADLDDGPRSQDRPSAQLRPNSDIQIYSPGSHGMRGQASGRTCPTNSGGKNWEPSAYNPELSLLYLPSDRRLQHHRDGRAKGLRRPGRHRQAARALYRRQHQEPRAPLWQPQGRRPGHRRDQGQSEAYLPKLFRCARHRRQPRVPRPLRRHLLGL